MYRSAACTLLLLSASAAVHGQQSLYVADKLVLNVYAEADQSTSRVATIETGDVVEELGRQENFVHVELPDGRQGWVGANYLTAQPPAIVKLRELQASIPPDPAAPSKQLTEDIAVLRKQNTALSTEIAALKKKQAAAAPSTPSPAAAPAAASMTPAILPASEPVEPPPVVPIVMAQQSYWWAWTLAVFAAGLAGYVLGYQTLGRRVRERFGGVKVY